MGQFTITKTKLPGVLIIEPRVFGDERGYFMETYNAADFERAGIACAFVQDNQSKSRMGVLRGLHVQRTHPQAKLVRVISGEVFDVAVDCRKGSETFGQWVGVHLSAENKRQFFIPKGFAHGFLTISESAEFCYKCDDFYHPEDEAGFLYNDPAFRIEWPKLSVPYLLSEKDLAYQPFR
jgi:dTDP-4-dehydrorhamnose 3,5-epimerase